MFDNITALESFKISVVLEEVSQIHSLNWVLDILVYIIGCIKPLNLLKSTYN